MVADVATPQKNGKRKPWLLARVGRNFFWPK